jgi:apolipoprotein N-acyltransferase
MMKVNTASPIRRTVSAMTRNRVIYAVVGVAWVGVGLSWVGTALLFLGGNSNASNSVANAVGATFAVAFSTAVVYFRARKR